jgi:hypothetical protein
VKTPVFIGMEGLVFENGDPVLPMAGLVRLTWKINHGGEAGHPFAGFFPIRKGEGRQLGAV